MFWAAAVLHRVLLVRLALQSVLADSFATKDPRPCYSWFHDLVRTHEDGPRTLHPLPSLHGYRQSSRSSEVHTDVPRGTWIGMRRLVIILSHPHEQSANVVRELLHKFNLVAEPGTVGAGMVLESQLVVAEVPDELFVELTALLWALPEVDGHYVKPRDESPDSEFADTPIAHTWGDKPVGKLELTREEFEAALQKLLPRVHPPAGPCGRLDCTICKSPKGCP